MKNQFIYNQEILNLLLLIFSCILFIYNKLQNAQILKYIFKSNKNYHNFKHKFCNNLKKNISKKYII